MLIITNLNLINVQSWTHLLKLANSEFNGTAFINSFNRRATDFHKHAIEPFELNFFTRKTFLLMTGKTILSDGQFAQCPALNDTPVNEKGGVALPQTNIPSREK